MKKLWVLTREYSGIAEAGGVGNVARSLTEEAVNNNFDVTIFIPLYECTDFSELSNFNNLTNINTIIGIDNNFYNIEFATAKHSNIKIVFIISPLFTIRRSVYTYTKQDEIENPLHKRGTGHLEALIMNVLFQKSVLDYGILNNIKPDIVHCHDAATAITPFFAKIDDKYNFFYNETKFFVTIHNAGPGYHHEIYNINYASRILHLPIEQIRFSLLNDCIEPYLLASACATLTTVSPWYAEELLEYDNHFTNNLSQEFANKNIKIIGITNGIDSNLYDPQNTSTSMLKFSYNPENGELQGKYLERKHFLELFSKLDDYENIKQYGFLTNHDDCIYFSYHGRLVWQKGIEIFIQCAERIIQNNDLARFVVIGQGQLELEQLNAQLAEKYPGKFLYLRGYDKFFARECVAISDFIIMPSLFEPCGLEDFIAQLFGTIPIASATGGLNKIINDETGFLYYPNTVEILTDRILDICNKIKNDKNFLLPIIKKAAYTVKHTYNWNTVFLEHYKPLFEN